MARAFLRFVDRSFDRLLVRAIIAYDRIRAALGGGRRRHLPGEGTGSGPRNILVIKLAGLGDTVLMLTPLARLRHEFPDAGITALVTPLSEGVLSVQASVDETIVHDVFGEDSGLPGLLRIIRLLRTGKFDCVVDFEQHFQLTSILAYFTGAPRRLGFYVGGSPGRGILTDPVRIDPARHMADSYMDLIGPLGLRTGRVEELEKIHIPGEDARYAAEWPGTHGRGKTTVYAGVHCSPSVHIHAGVVNDCVEGHCIEAISVDEVWDAVVQSDRGRRVQ